METEVEFRILGAVCHVVPEDAASATIASESGAGAYFDSLPVIGDCTVQGRRYLILCEESRAPSESVPIGVLLTQRELQVAVMVSEGEGNKQIADRLKLSEWTVSSYLRRIYAKLGVHTRAAMVAQVIAEIRRQRVPREDPRPSTSDHHRSGAAGRGAPSLSGGERRQGQSNCDCARQSLGEEEAM